LWRSKELKDQATASSVVAADIRGVRQYINSTFKGAEGGGVAGVDAQTGKLPWYFPNDRYNVYAAGPTPSFHVDPLYRAGGYRVGCNLSKVSKGAAAKSGGQAPYGNPAGELMQSEHGGVVLVDGYIYGYSDTLGWLCQEFKKGGEVWSDRQSLEGKGSLT